MKKGISVVALVITIIVLVIITGAVLIALDKDNNLIQRANEARYGKEDQQVIEILSKAYMETKVRGYTKNEEINGYIKQEVEKVYSKDSCTVSNSEKGIEVNILELGTYIIDEKGNIYKDNPIQITNLKILKENEEEIPVEGLEEGEKIKITFEASINRRKDKNNNPRSAIYNRWR